MARGLKTEIGTEVLTQNGYVNVKTEDGWKYKHIMLMEKKLKRPLEDNERVYFVDGDKTNIKISNLEVRIKEKRLPSLTSIQKVRTRLDKIEETVLGELDELREAINELESKISS